MQIVIFLLILNVLIIVHEIGHYVAAVTSGVVVKDFAIGFGPTLIHWKMFGTTWKINLFPLGGYNNLKGEFDEEGEKGDFTSARTLFKLKILVAGAFMNIVLAVIMFYIVLIPVQWKWPVMVDSWVIGGKVEYLTGKEGVELVSALPESSLAQIDLKYPVDLIRVDGKEVKTMNDVTFQIKNGFQNKRQEINIEIITQEGENEILSVKYLPTGKLGIELSESIKVINYGISPITKVFAGWSHSANLIFQMGSYFKTAFSDLIFNKDATTLSNGVSGPVGVYNVVGEVVEKSENALLDLTALTALIGLNLGVFNLLPIPGLDGWHILITLVERLTQKKFNAKILMIVSLVGIGLLMLLTVVISIKDIITMLN